MNICLYCIFDEDRLQQWWLDYIGAGSMYMWWLVDEDSLQQWRLDCIFGVGSTDMSGRGRRRRFAIDGE
ncbi:hypothetical protein L6452_30866 [Arctium lappa]|uniref:Uncharacterized protein n=1 Tax=Arctium lappa TaxID=4217 RepID=A0ACB8ZIG5_ARCLA|nr:hypothetical protein L6452_30866 [Arctium lappa]